MKYEVMYIEQSAHRVVEVRVKHLVIVKLDEHDEIEEICDWGTHREVEGSTSYGDLELGTARGDSNTALLNMNDLPKEDEVEAQEMMKTVWKLNYE